MSKKCIYCGAELEDDDLFCDVCGRKQEENTSHKAVQTPSHEETSAVEEKTKEEVVLCFPSYGARASASIRGKRYSRSEDVRT